MSRVLSIIGRVALLSVLSSPLALATIIRVPSDQPTIQTGINAATNGDTVLVDPGTYFENINFNGKRIIVGSIFLLSGDTSYISQTVIRGSSGVSVVTFGNNEDLTSILTGFTITGGSRGIFCQNSSPVLQNLIVVNNSGYGGIYCVGSSPTIAYVKIMNNYSSQYGGGLYCSSSYPSVANSTIVGNSAQFEGGGVYCSNASPTLTNVIIMSNTAYIDGGGIYCRNNSAPLIQYSTILNNTASWYGGGIYCDGSNPMFNTVVVKGNNALRYWGGGLYCRNSSPTLTNVLITENKVHRYVGGNSGGGGISSLLNSNPILSNVTISRNSARRFGGGIYVDDNSTVTFNTIDRCNIYLNEANSGYDVYSRTMFPIVVDTFTVMNPRDEHTYPLGNFTFDILHAKASQSHSTLYVSTVGDNGNSGLTRGDPLRTIGFAKSIVHAVPETSGTIYLAPGIYSYETNGENFGLSWRSHLTLKGNDVNTTILQGDNDVGILYFNGISNAAIEDLTMKNGRGLGGAIFSNSSSLASKNIRITGCNATQGGAVYGSFNSNITLVNALIFNNSASLFGGALYSHYSRYNLINVTIANNSAGAGSGIYCQASRVSVVNSILWYNSSVYFEPLDNPSYIDVANSNIQFGQGGIQTNGNGTINWMQGNMDAEPGFVSLQNGDFHLANESPCIGAGTDSIEIGGLWFFSPDEDIERTPRPNPVNTNPDIGAYESQLSVPTIVVDDEGGTIKYTALFQNYPNPFNPSTVIRYQIPEASYVSLKVYDLLGKEVATLVDEAKEAGYYQAVFDASAIASGMYFYRMVAGSYVAARKFVVLK